MDRVAWLRTYARKVLFVAFLGTHVPLIALIVYLSARYEPLKPSTALLLTLAATLTSTAGVLWTMDRLMVPIRLATRALGRYLETGDVEELPTDLNDEVGTLLRNVNHSVLTFERHRNELERSAHTDALTGLLNRRGLEARLRETNVLDRESSICIALVDIDHFKSFNDTFGHSMGDIALQKFGRYLHDICCEKWGSEWDFIVRWGGEEFLLLLPATAACTFLEALRVGVQSIDLEQSHRATITISAGYAVRRPEESINECIHRADEALYRAKVEGRDRVLAALAR